jgi:site-specific recombinase XerD
MNVKKFPEPDPVFYEKCRAAATSDFQRGIVFILQATGMHLACLLGLTPSQMDAKGDIHWKRTKNDRPMRARVPSADRMTVRAWIDRYGSNKKSESGVQWALKEVGARAGFPDLSPMTFRAQRAVVLLDEGMPPHEVAHIMGCSPEVLNANYAQLKSDRRVQ